MMSSTGFNLFDHTVHETNQLLKKVEDEFGWTDRRQQSYAIVRAVLHAVRDRIPYTEAISFSAQLPLLLKGVFFDGWSPELIPEKCTRKEFIEKIRSTFPYSTDSSIEEVIATTFQLICEQMDPPETTKILNLLPDDIRELLIGTSVEEEYGISA